MLRFILSVFRYCFNKIFNFFLWKRTVENMEDFLKITIKSGIDKSVSVEVDPKWTIGEVKQKVAPKVCLNAQEIRVIFAGQELDDSIVIEDCDLSEQSIIHIVKSSTKPVPRLSKQGLISDLLKEKLSESESKVITSAKRVHFYVYCPTCKTVRHGKLRVRCVKCKLGTLTVSQEPTCWLDVLEPGRISGTCQSETCDGDIAEFYFKCVNHTSIVENVCVVLYMIKPNLFDIPCLACMEVSNPILVFECAESHNLCLSCFKDYCIAKLNDRTFFQHPVLGYTLPCPEHCEESLIKETHHFKLVGEDQYLRYQRFATEECLLQAGGVLCPQPGCGAGILPDEECRKIVCVKQGNEGCGYVFCKYCLQGYHLGDCTQGPSQCSKNDGDLDAFHTERSKWDDASKLTIKVSTKPCPKCRTPTERDGGCMHMVCGRSQCGFHWCWLCQEEWTRDCMGNHWFG